VEAAAEGPSSCRRCRRPGTGPAQT
jgi:hypothetical protein